MEKATGGECVSCGGEFPKSNEETKRDGCACYGGNSGEEAPAAETPAAEAPAEETPAAE